MILIIYGLQIEKSRTIREFKLIRVIRQTANGKRQAKKKFTASGNKE
jgi:hypothetical protein